MGRDITDSANGRIAVTGSIAEDYLMSFPGAFSELIMPEEIADLALSFLIDDMDVRPGGIAANICFGLGQLGTNPLLVGAAGPDFTKGYEGWLRSHSVETSTVRISEDKRTARFLCTTDREENQIASFYTGAMADASKIDVLAVCQDLGGADVVVVSPNDPDAMLRHHADALAADVPVVADPSQQLARLEPDQIRQLVDGATYLMSNAYEAALITKQTGWSEDEVLARVGTWVTTHGADGSRIRRRGEPTINVPPVPPGQAIEPTGVGDAFRAGFLAARTRGLSLERSAQLGSLMATHVIETVGPQGYLIDHVDAIKRFAQAYGDDAAADVDHLLAKTNLIEPPAEYLVS